MAFLIMSILPLVGQGEVTKQPPGEIGCPLPDIADGHAGHLQNGIEIEKENYSEGDKIYVDCNAGYRISGITELKCLETGWSDDYPRCDPMKTCPKLYDIANGIVSQPEKAGPWHSARFSCIEGYVLDGKETAMCQLNGSWDLEGSIYPACRKKEEVKTCPKLYDIANGIVSQPEKAGPWHSARFSCIEGYVLDGKETAMCQLNGSWDLDGSIYPECRKKEEGFTMWIVIVAVLIVFLVVSVICNIRLWRDKSGLIEKSKSSGDSGLSIEPEDSTSIDLRGPPSTQASGGASQPSDASDACDAPLLRHSTSTPAIGDAHEKPSDFRTTSKSSKDINVQLEDVL